MKRNILFIMKDLADGGSEKVLITLLKNFDFSRFNVDLMLIHRGGVFCEDVPKCVKIKYMYSRALSLGEKINYHLLMRLRCDLGYKITMKFKVLRKYDVIISFLQGPSLKYHSYVTNKGRRNISWVHSDLFKIHNANNRFFTEVQEKKSYSKMDKIIFVSNDAQKQFERLYSDILTPKEVILNPIEKDLIVQYKREFKRYIGDRCFNIVAVGRLSEEKGFDLLVRLAKRLKDNGYNFHINIIGEGDLRGELENLIVKHQVGDEVSLVGFVKPPYEEMSKADLFISPSLIEGFSLVVAEAFCLGLPIVSTKTTGPMELLEDNKYGLLIEYDDESIYQAVKKMIDDDELREHYHKKSLERAETFDIDSVMNQIYSIL